MDLGVLAIILFVVAMAFATAIVDGIQFTSFESFAPSSKTQTKFAPPDCSNKSSNILWIHPPKTASTFCMSIQHACCKDPFEALADLVFKDVNDSLTKSLHPSSHVDLGWGCLRLRFNNSTCISPIGHGHRPLDAKLSSPFELSRVAIFLREPKDRLLSAYFDGMHSEGLPEYMYRVAAWRNNSLSTTLRFRAYIHHPALQGCYVKMINGFDCAAHVNITQSMLVTAKERLKQFFFVGIFENYTSSIDRFHRLMGRGTSKHPVELAPSRTFQRDLPLDPTKWSKDDIAVNAKRSQERSDAIKELKDYYDRWDSVLYSEAVKLVEGHG